MASVELRPRFRFLTSLCQEDIVAAFKLRFDDRKIPESIYGTALENLITVRIPGKQQHYWSPQLELSLESKENGLTRVRGLLGPKPGIWTKFLFGYGVLGIVFFISLMIGTSQMTLGKDPLAFWVALASSVALVALYAIGLAGKAKALPQMKELHAFMLDAIGDTVEPELEI